MKVLAGRLNYEETDTSSILGIFQLASHACLLDIWMLIHIFCEMGGLFHLSLQSLLGCDQQWPLVNPPHPIGGMGFDTAMFRSIAFIWRNVSGTKEPWGPIFFLGPSVLWSYPFSSKRGWDLACFSDKRLRIHVHFFRPATCARFVRGSPYHIYFWVCKWSLRPE